MRTIRGLQITSLVVLSPVLLIMISLFCMLVMSVYSLVNSWIFQTAVIPHVLQQQQQQQFTTIRNVSSDISIPYQRNLNTSKQFKRIRMFSRLRQSPMTWIFLSMIYAAYIILKKKRNTKQKQVLDSASTQAIEPAKPLRKKSSKRRKIKKVTSAVNEPRHRPRSIQIASPPPSTPPTTIVNNQTQENQPSQPQQQDVGIGNWISVASSKKKKELNVNIASAPTTTTTTAATTSTHFFPSPTFSCASSTNEHVKTEQPLNLYSYEPTPVHSEDDADDEEEEEQDSRFIQKGTSSNKNWYSPFSTGLDLDIIPKQNQSDPLCLYKVDFNYNTNIPNSTTFSSSHPFRSIISSFHPPLSSIELLENHPFIPSSANTKNHRNAFGPIGHKASVA